jgi:oligopeptide/dipeptide ABC transporter ATP-binding protein
MSTERTVLLQIDDLHVSFPGSAGPVEAVRGASISVGRREVHALVGESGSGKSVTARSILGLLGDSGGRVDRGRILFRGEDLLGAGPERLRAVRGGEIAMIFQEPGKHLNPAMKIRTQITEMLAAHRGMREPQALRRARELMQMVELREGDRVLESYPHQLSGGQRQRALIAMAISCNPKLLIADEPTTALDANIQGQIMRLLLKLRDELSMAVLFISHDLAVVQAMADTISVIYAGSILEGAPAQRLFARPLQPYTDLLMRAIPDAAKRGSPLAAIPGTVPDAEHVPAGCPFHPRCPIAQEICSTQTPELAEHEEAHYAACHFAGALGGNDG